MKEKRNFDAKQTLERARQIAPESEIVPVCSSTSAALNCGDTQGAIRAYEDLLKVNPRHSAAHR